MEIKKYLKALPAVAALLLTASCSSDNNNEIVEAPQPAQARIVPFTVSASSGSSQTRATLDGHYYKFQANDKLYVWGDNGKIYGELTRDDGADYDCTFSGNLTVEAGGSLVNGTTILSAVIKSENDQILGTLDEFKTRGFVPSYTSAIASSNEDAVQKFSFLKAKTDYNNGWAYFSFDNSQNSTFLSFDITLEDGTAADKAINVTINNGGKAVRTGSVTTSYDSGDIRAKFVAGFPSGTTLSEANIKLGSRDAISFGKSEELQANKIYNVAKTYTTYKITADAPGIHREKTDKKLPLNTTLSELIGNKANDLTALSVKEGGDGNITFGEFDSTNPGATTVSITGIGTTVILISGASVVDIPPLGLTNVPFENVEVTLTVSKMTDE